MNSADLSKIRAKQEEEQDAALDELIENVRGLKGGQHAIKDELQEQDGLLGVLGSLGRPWTTRWTATSTLWARPGGG
jgi:hypothetical protein